MRIIGIAMLLDALGLLFWLFYGLSRRSVTRSEPHG